MTIYFVWYEQSIFNTRAQQSWRRRLWTGRILRRRRRRRRRRRDAVSV